MNRRLVLFDQNEINGAMLFGGGLSTDIHPIQAFQNLSDVEIKDWIKNNLGDDSDAVMLVGGNAFKWLRQFIHFGVRGENYSDCAKLYRLPLGTGNFAKCCTEVPNSKEIQEFMTPEFTKHVDFSWFRYKCISDYESAIKFLDWLDSLPENEDFGYDIEASGMPLDKWFEWSGAAISTTKIAGFLSFTDLRHNCTSEQYQYILIKLRDFLVKRQEHIWTYNVQYEYQVSHRMLGCDLHSLCDASVINVLDGYHLKKYSLKWTAARVLYTDVWDAEFDYISELIDSMLFEEVGKLKKDKQKVLKVTPENFKYTPEWQELSKIYPNDIDEMEKLMIEFWPNSQFMSISSRILSLYCCRDAHYTLLIYKAKENEYSKEAFKVFLDNTRLGARLHSSGLYIDEEFRLKYHIESLKLMAWGITYCATARCVIKMKKHSSKMANIKKYSPVAVKLLNENHFYNGNSLEIVKYILSTNIDTMDTNPIGINDGSLLMTYGPEFAENFIDLVTEAMKKADMIKLNKKTGNWEIKSKLDSGVVRKKKLLGILAEDVKPLLGLDKLKLGPKHEELEKYLYYERAYKELTKVSETQLNDINNIPTSIYAFGQMWELDEYYKYISDNYFPSRSPEENDKMCEDFANLYKAESAYLAAILESTQQLNGAEKFYENLGITTIEDAFNHFMGEWKRVYEGTPVDQTSYPEKMYTLAYQFYNDPASDQVKEVWSNFNGYIAQSQFFKYLDKEYELYSQPFKESDLDNRLFFMRKLTISYLLQKKYSKVDSTYICGMFKANNRFVIEGPDHIPIRYADPDEPGAIEKCFVHYEVNTKNSKRWSSGFHTILSHADLKDCIITPPGIGPDGQIIPGGGDFVMTYYDISSAEVKAAGFASQDPDLIAKFEAGEDIYIYSAKLYLKDFDSLPKDEKKIWRKRFKTIFLGVLYGLGKNSLAERLNCSVEESEKIIQSLYTSFPKLREYVENQQMYPIQHGGYINTMLGDKLKLIDYETMEKSSSQKEKRGLEAAVKRKGVNFAVQGGCAAIMASGFEETIVESIREGWKNPLQPIIVVHDSNTNYVPTSMIFDIRKFYDTYYTGYCRSIGPRITLLFDLLVGDSYERAMEMKQIDDNTIEFKGSAYSMIKIYNKIMNCKDLKVECDHKLEELIPSWVEHPIQRFIMEKSTCIIKDISSYTVRFKRY